MCRSVSIAEYLPQEVFMRQIRRFAEEVLPALQAHKVETVPLAEEVPA